ncbi:MAG: YDG domain-containing protein, partial [Deltaproteobacteria bacterium]|nr:YDG domain-containing protein [Deltaproteobacteria bacterium]
TTTADINPKALTLAATAADKTYDGNASATVTGYGLSGFVGTETVSAGSTSALFDNKNAGTGKSVTISGITLANGDNGGLAANYAVANATTTTADVNPAALSITANDASKTYGQTIAFSGTEFASTGLQNNETVGSVSLASPGAAATAGVAGSPYAIVPSGAAGGTFDAANYTISYHNGSLTVTPAALVVTARDDSRIYDGLPYRGGNGVVYAGFVNGESGNDLSGTLAYGGTSQGATNLGTYAIQPSGLTSDNYAITFAEGRLAINANPNGENLNSVLTSTQQGVNGTQQSQVGNQGTTTSSMGPGTGSTSLSAGANNPVLTDSTAGQTAGSVVLSSNSFYSQISIATSGQTMTLSSAGAGSGTSASPVEMGTLPVFAREGSGAPSLQGNYVMHQSDSSLSLTQTTAAGITAAPGTGDMTSTAPAPFTMTQENGMVLQMSVMVTGDGTLVITVPDGSASLDVRQVVLVAMQAARESLHTDLGDLSSALIVR